MSELGNESTAVPAETSADGGYEDRIRGFLAELSGESEHALTDDRELLDSGLVASLQVLEIVDFLEDQLDVLLAPTEVSPERFRTIGDLARLVREKKETPA